MSRDKTRPRLPRKRKARNTGRQRRSGKYEPAFPAYLELLGIKDNECTLCEEHIPPKGFTQHLKSFEHLQQLDAKYPSFPCIGSLKKPSTDPEDPGHKEFCICAVCLVEHFSNITNHYQSKKHLQAMARYEEGKKEQEHIRQLRKAGQASRIRSTTTTTTEG